MFSTALLIFTFAAISDALDGLLARYFNQYSELGSILDPIADKLLLSSSFVCLAVLDVVPGWLSVIVITRDILIVLAIGIFIMVDIEIKIKPSVLSKWTTVAQLVTIILVLLAQTFSPIDKLIPAFLWITAGLTILSAFHYVYYAMNIIQDAASGQDQE
jgi:cardiolipin synthase